MKTYKPNDEQEVLTTETEQENQTDENPTVNTTEIKKPTKREIYFDVAGGYL